MNYLTGRIVQQIWRTVDKEEKELHQIGASLFFMPELVLPYLVGKNISLALQEDPEFDSMVWQREMGAARNGWFDLVFTRSNVPVCIVDLKMVTNDDDYLSDIEKLASLRKAPLHILCALVEASAVKENDDDRIMRLENRARSAGIDVCRIRDSNVFGTFRQQHKLDFLCYCDVGT